MAETAKIPKPKRQIESIQELQDMLKAMTRSIVDAPEEIFIYPAPGDEFVHFEVRCDDNDVGTLLGRRGMHADAIRTLMMAAGAVRGLRVTLQILGRNADHKYAPVR